ncbi:hypothetical protein Tco_0022343, partial [Tanacetum coccineum]
EETKKKSKQDSPNTSPGSPPSPPPPPPPSGASGASGQPEPPILPKLLLHHLRPHLLIKEVSQQAPWPQVPQRQLLQLNTLLGQRLTPG